MRMETNRLCEDEKLVSSVYFCIFALILITDHIGDENDSLSYIQNSFEAKKLKSSHFASNKEIDF